MKIALSTDHVGFEAVRDLQRYLESLGHECVYFGPEQLDQNDDYPDYIEPAAQAVARGDCEAGIIFGGSGHGEAMAANRVRGVRCNVYYGPAQAEMAIDAEGAVAQDAFEILRLSRRHNNANMLSLAGRFLDAMSIHQAATIWLETPYNNEARHRRRIEKLDTIAVSAEAVDSQQSGGTS